MSSQPDMPDYRGAPLDPDRGPGLGCFWIQIGLLAVLLVATPVSVIMAVEPWISGVLLIVTLILLLFVGQTTIFLLRLVAADRRTRRRPMSGSARKTVGQLEEEESQLDEAEAAQPDEAPVDPESSQSREDDEAATIREPGESPEDDPRSGQRLP